MRELLTMTTIRNVRPSSNAAGIPSPPRNAPGLPEPYEQRPGPRLRSARLNFHTSAGPVDGDNDEVSVSSATRVSPDLRRPAVGPGRSLGLQKYVILACFSYAVLSFFQGLVPGNAVDRIRFARGMLTCHVPFESDVATLKKVLKSMAKAAHPDKVRGPKGGICSIEEINFLLDQAKSIDRMDYVSYAAGMLRVPPHMHELIPMVGAVLVIWLVKAIFNLSARKLAQAHGRQTSRLAKVFGTLFLALPASGAKGMPNYGMIVARLEHSKFFYGTPPCATICGKVPSSCVHYGYLTDDIYTYWYDQDQGVCASIKTNVPRAALHKMNQLGMMSFMLSLTDGFQITDIATLVAGSYFYAQDCAKIAEAADVSKKVAGLIASY